MRGFGLDYTFAVTNSGRSCVVVRGLCNRIRHEIVRTYQEAGKAMKGLFFCRHRQLYRLSSLLVGLLLLTGLQSAAALESGAVANCPSAAELGAQLSAQKDSQLKLKAGLEAFIAGAAGTEIPLTALFSIDVTDADKVAQRVAELQQSMANPGAVAADTLLACALAEEKFAAVGADIQALQADITRLRLQFLRLPADKRAVILHPQIEASQQADTVYQLRQEHQSVLQQQQQSAKALVKVEQQVIASTTDTEAAWAAQRAELERVRGDMASLHLKWLVDLEAQATFYQQTSEKLAEIAKFLLQPEPTSTLSVQYQKCLTIWRQLVDMTPQVVSGRFARALPKLPSVPKDLLIQAHDSPAAEDYRMAYRAADTLRSGLQDKINSRLQESADLHYRVLLQSGEIRSQLLNTLLDQGDLAPLKFSLSLLHDLKREIIIVPFRWTATFYLRWLDVRQQLQQGWKGAARIATDMVLLLGFLCIPWLVWQLSYGFSSKLNRLRLQFVQRSRRHTQAIQLALALQKLQPYAPWLLMLLALYAVQSLLALAQFAQLSNILSYLRYYIYYRMFRLLMQCDFLWLNNQLSASKFGHLRRQLDRVTRVLGMASLLVFSLLFAIESLIQRGLVYHFSITAFSYLGLLLGVVFSYQWRSIVVLALTRFMPGRLGSTLAKLCNTGWALLFALPALLLLLFSMLLRILLGWFSHFEMVRRIAATVFRYQLESAIDKNPAEGRAPLPADYLQGFTFEGVATVEQLQEPALEDLEEIHALLDQWLDGSSAVHSLVIVGDKGVGKSCLLGYLQQRYPEQALKVNVPDKLITCEQVHRLLASALNLSTATDIAVVADTFIGPAPETTTCKRSIILIDDAHNLFLAIQGGFEGFQTLLTLISQSSRQVFWCMTFNHHAWNYMNSVNGRQQYFGTLKHLTPWSETAIQELILGMHKRTEYRLSYDDILQAAGSQVHYGHVAYIESRFFSLLWQQSRGNPRLAVYLWLSALWQVDSNSLRVGLPEEPDGAPISDMSDDALFVFASIARHENLTLPQLLTTTQLPEGVVRHVLEEGVRMKLLSCQSDGVYRLAVLYYYPLVRYLQANRCLL